MVKKGEYGETEPLKTNKFVYYADPRAEGAQNMGLTPTRWS